MARAHPCDDFLGCKHRNDEAQRPQASARVRKLLVLIASPEGRRGGRLNHSSGILCYTHPRTFTRVSGQRIILGTGDGSTLSQELSGRPHGFLTECGPEKGVRV